MIKPPAVGVNKFTGKYFLSSGVLEGLGATERDKGEQTLKIVHLTDSIAEGIKEHTPDKPDEKEYHKQPQQDYEACR